MFSYGRMMPDDQARVEALRRFLSRQAEEVIVVVGPGDTLTFHQSTRTGTAKIGH